MRQTCIIIALIASLVGLSTDASASNFDGRWQLNLEESDKVSVTYEEGSGAGRSKIFQNISMTVMGLPLPTRSKTPSQSSMMPKSPKVLLCNVMEIATDAKLIKLLFDDDGKETLRRGHYRGRDAKWSAKKIEEKYKTPDRKVTKTWTLRSDGRLRVDVKINPPKDKARTYSRVFDRVE